MRYNFLVRSPLVTISIPTYNSGKTLATTLKTIKQQDYKNIEVNIIDSFSTDNTIEIAEKFKVNEIKQIKAHLLRARYEGVKIAKGDYILIFDSDQILEPDAISRAVAMMEKVDLDMLVFEESVYEVKTFIERLFQYDRMLINAVNNLSPFTGVIMPRMFKQKLILKAYQNIPKEMFPHTGGPDHAIVYYECWLMSKKIGVLPHAVKHLEPKTLGELLRKFYRWGYTSVDAHYGKYQDLMIQKERFRTGLFSKNLFIESLGSILLLLLKGVSFKTGYYIGVYHKRNQNR